MDALEAIRERRSIRRFKADPVPQEALRTLLEAARWAPSWGNTQCWRMIVVQDLQLQGKLADTVAATAGRAALAIRSVPVVLAACAELGKSGFQRTGEHAGQPATDRGDWFMFDVALALGNLTLAAHALGLGTVHVGLFDHLRAEEVLGVPQGFTVVELMPVGYPDEKPDPRPRKSLEEFVYYNAFGQGFSGRL